MEESKSKDPQKSLLKFPCTFPVKIMGLNKPELEKLVKKVFDKNVTEKHKDTIEIKQHLSKHKNYLSITVSFKATSKKQLDTIYQALSEHCGQEEDKIIKVIL
jgi:uncharacterized protein